MSAVSGKKILNKLQMFASFKLGSTELAISVVSLQEVVNVPEAISPVPLAPSYLKGIFNLRGTVIPVVDMGILLDLSHSEGAAGKIAVVVADGVKIGLYFDSTSEILNVPADSVCHFNDNPEGVRSVVKSVLKLNNGERLVEVIDPASLLKIENIASLVTASRGNGDEAKKKKFTRRQCITFKSGSRDFGLNLSAIREIIRVPEIKRSSMQVKYSLGVVSLRGVVIPVLDFKKFLQVDELGTGEDAEAQRIIILKIQEFFIGFLVDSVDSIKTYFEEDLLPIPMFKQEKVNMMRGMLAVSETCNVLLLAEDQLFTDGEIHEFTRGHSALYSKENSKALEKETAGERHPYISFKLEYMLSTRLSSVDEIANLTEDMVKPPGYPDYVVGVQHMRGEVVTLVDLRMYYGMKFTGDYSNSRILIVRGAQGKIGLLVDSVESIDTVDEAKKIKIPSLFAKDAITALRGDIQEVIEMPDQSGKKKIFMVLDMPEVLNKLLNPNGSAA
ncbi:chemotaxis protein CheW [Bdellovibrio sp. HCB185ZH]|uniref:chemotaxis protein CheW n=1 Tax=Bdellovibrio sp. HCB185ZH TaxID=3394235 RepID=UPI0039A71D32